jgi:tetratricopeptide (TPR) repeat protein
MRKLALILVFLITASSFSFAQRKKLDSLLSVTKGAKRDTTLAQNFVRISRLYDNVSLYDSSHFIGKQALTLAEEILRNSKDEKIVRSAKRSKAAAFNAIGITFFDQGNYPEALKNHYSSLKLSEENGDRKAIAASYNNIGLVCADQDEFTRAIENYESALKIYKEIGMKAGIASAYNNIGIVLNNQKKPEESLKNHQEALAIRLQTKDRKGLTYSYNNIGLVYFKLGKYDLALENHFASLRIKDSLGDKAGIAGSYCNIGQVLVKQKKYSEAKDYLGKAEALSKKIGQREYLKTTYKEFSVLDSAIGDFKSAFLHQRMYLIYRDSLDNEDIVEKSVQSRMNYEFEKKEALAKAEQDKKDAIQYSETRRKNVILASVILGLIMMFFFAIIILRALKVSRKQKITIEMQKNIVDQKQKEILDSIQYAKRIQMALMPSDSIIAKGLIRKK